MAPPAPPVLDRLRSTVRDLVSLLSSADASVLRRAPGPREWSASTVVAHLADAELVYGVRVRMLLAEDGPMLLSWDEKAWAARFEPVGEEPRDVLGRWRVLREANLRLLETVTEAEWRRTGTHERRGVESLADVAQRMADHDRAHLDQIRRALAASPR